MNTLNSAFQAFKQVFQRRKEARERIRKAPGSARFATPFLEVLEDRTLLSANPALLGEATGIAVANTGTLPEATPAHFSYLGYPAQITAANQLTVFATGDID